MQTKCDYCGTYFLDVAAINLDGKTPCFMRIKTQQGIILVKTFPNQASFEINNDYTSITDRYGNTVRSLLRSTMAELNMTFQCVEFEVPNTKQKALYVVDTRG